MTWSTNPRNLEQNARRRSASTRLVRSSARPVTEAEPQSGIAKMVTDTRHDHHSVNLLSPRSSLFSTGSSRNRHTHNHLKHLRRYTRRTYVQQRVTC
jgi:hypothetical protein